MSAGALESAGRGRRAWTPGRIALAAVLGATALCALAGLALGAKGAGQIPSVAVRLAACLLLALAGGEALTHRLTPPALWRWRWLLVLPVGLAASSLALTLLGYARLPLPAGLALLGAGGLAASLLVRAKRFAPAHPRPAAAVGDERLLLAAWAGVALLVVAVALTPAWRHDILAVFGENPDAHQVVGTAVLLQEAYPGAVREDLPIDVIPVFWASKYPIYEALAAASTLAAADPITVFPVMAALVAACAALGFGVLAVACFGLPAWGGLAVTAGTGASFGTLHMALHPYWNQLWGFAMMPWAILFAWLALRDRHAGAALLCALTLALAALGYPLMLGYPIAIAVAFAVALGYRPRLPKRLRRRRGLALAGGLVLAVALLQFPPVNAAAWRTVTAVATLFDPDSTLLGGDVERFTPLGEFVGTGGGWWALVPVAAFALLALWRLVPRPAARALAVALLVFGVVAVRFRIVEAGTYVDYKHLSYVGGIVLALALSGALWLLGTRRRPLVALGAVALLAWGVATAAQDRKALRVGLQAPRSLLEVREWSRELPPGASVRIDIPPSGRQLWAAYLLADRPTNTPNPVIYTTYAHPPRGVRADYSLAAAGAPRPPTTVDPPVRENGGWVLRRIVLPPHLRDLPETATRRAVQP